MSIPSSSASPRWHDADSVRLSLRTTLPPLSLFQLGGRTIQFTGHLGSAPYVPGTGHLGSAPYVPVFKKTTTGGRRP